MKTSFIIVFTLVLSSLSSIALASDEYCEETAINFALKTTRQTTYQNSELSFAMRGEIFGYRIRLPNGLFEVTTKKTFINETYSMGCVVQSMKPVKD